MKNTRHKAIQPLCGMELQRFNKKETRRLALPTQSESFKTTVILITANIEKEFSVKNIF